jgi:hypothetical protein
MTSPQPPSALDGRCSAIYDNTLYVYTSSALLSLPLESGAEWNSLDAGQSVTGAVCVTGNIDDTSDDQALYVVGGTSDNSTYSGLQRYSFGDDTWESIPLNIADLENRVNHSAIYIPGTYSILVYAGSTDSNEDASTSTYEIPVNNGWVVQSRSDDGSPAGIQPVLLPWDNSTAVYVGGTSTNTEVFLYHGLSGWGTSQISLAEGIPSDAGVAIVSNSDGSKFLEIFDVTTSPNNVSYVALLQTGGQPAYPGEAVTFDTSSSSTKKQKRDWGETPAYNTSNAPSTTRTSFSIAQSSNDLVVISSGSGTDCLSVFNQTQNGWVNTTELFYSGVSGGLQVPLTTSTSSASTTSATATTTSAAASTTTAASSSTSISTGVIIGATIGSLLGVAAILIVLLLILRRLHGKKAGSGGKSGRRFGSQDKDRLSFEDQGIEPLTMAAVPMARSNGPSAVDSLDMISGKFANEYRSSMTAGNGVVTRSLVPPAASPMPTIASSRAGRDENDGIMLAAESDRPKGDRSTDEGWGKYFQDGKGSELTTDSPRTTMNSDISEMTKSDYRSSMWPHQVPEATSIALGALDKPKPLGQVSSGSPSTEHLPMSGNSHLHQGQSALIDSASLISDDDDHNRHDAFSSGIPPSVQDGNQWSQPWYMRPPSSNYTDSFYQPSARESSGLHESVPTDARSNGRRSSGILHDNYPRNNVNSDMSWLNLHADK